jgi:hypothetical protein
MDTKDSVTTGHVRNAGGAILVTVLAFGCSSDIFDVSVALTPEIFSADFGSASGMIPTVPCDSQNPAICGGDQLLELADGSGQATIKLGCDAGTARCFAQANARGTYTVDVLQDDSFTSKVERHAVTLVRMVDLTITIPANTMTFDIPEIDLFVGPPGTQQPSDPGVFPVDNVRSIAAGTIIAAADARHLVVADGSPARGLIEDSIRSKTPFVFVVTLAPRLESGAVLPAGKLEVDIQPLLSLGLR